MRPRCVELARVLKKTGSFYYHCDWHASHYVKQMLDQIFASATLGLLQAWFDTEPAHEKTADLLTGNRGYSLTMTL